MRIGKLYADPERVMLTSKKKIDAGHNAHALRAAEKVQTLGSDLGSNPILSTRDLHARYLD